MPDPTGLQYMPGGKLYGLNSPFITSNNPPAPSTANKLGYLGLSGTNSATYTPPPAGTATVDNPGVFVPSQPLLENTNMTRSANVPGGGSYGFNPVASAPGNGGANNGAGNSFGFNPLTNAPGNTTTPTNTPNSFGFNPIPGAGTTGGLAPQGVGHKQGYQQSSGLPQLDAGTVTQQGDGLNYSNAQDQVANALFDQQQSIFSPYRPQGSGFFRSRF